MLPKMVPQTHILAIKCKIAFLKNGKWTKFESSQDQIKISFESSRHGFRKFKHHTFLFQNIGYHSGYYGKPYNTRKSEFSQFPHILYMNSKFKLYIVGYPNGTQNYFIVKYGCSAFKNCVDKNFTAKRTIFTTL